MIKNFVAMIGPEATILVLLGIMTLLGIFMYLTSPRRPAVRMSGDNRRGLREK